MSATASVLQLVRAHYQRDDMRFAGAAAALARAAKAPVIRDQIHELIRRGYQGRGPSNPTGFNGDRYSSPEPREMKPLPSAPTSAGLYALPVVAFEDLLLDPAIQLELDNIVTELEYRSELSARGLRARSRFLFHGPPGNGKTSVSSALAQALGAEAHCVSISDLVSTFQGGTAKALGEVFGSLRSASVVVFDEIDAVGSERADDSNSKEKASTVNALLQLFDRHKSGVVIATTNRPDMLDPALLRRFDERIFFPEPTPEQMASLSAKLSEKFGVEVVPVEDCRNFDEVAKRVEREARRIVMRELIEADSESEDDSTTH